MFDSFKGSSTVAEGIDTKSMEFKKLADLVGKGKQKIYGFFFTNKGKYGKQAVLVCETFLVNMPKWTVEKFEGLTTEEIDALKTGGWYIDNVAELYTSNGKTYNFDFVQ